MTLEEIIEEIKSINIWLDENLYEGVTTEYLEETREQRHDKISRRAELVEMIK